MQAQTIPANSDKPCDACNRIHRKLYLLDGYWMGNACADHYSFYVRTKDITDSYWRGYEKQHAKIQRMVEGGA